MVKNSLREFIESALDSGIIGEGEVARLHREILPDDLTSREEAVALVALDRAVMRKCEMWDKAFVRLLVNFAVWASRPTGKINREMATWITTTLGSGSGPTPNGIKAAFEIVCEAQQVDESLIAFVLDGARNKPVNGGGKPPRGGPLMRLAA
jgi:hypothetical protein